MKVLLLEDDIVFADIIFDFLTQLHCNISMAYDGEEALDLLYTERFDLLLLDINVPKFDGLSLLEKYRDNGFKTPVIMITSFTNTDKIEKAYELGCDDYIKKPFSLEELHARIQYIKKIYKIENFEIIKINQHYSFDTYNMQIIQEEQVINLPKKEGEIIVYFLNNKNRIISISELTVHIWEFDNEPSIATIRTYIKNIRKHFDNQFIHTIKGMGYMFKVP